MCFFLLQLFIQSINCLLLLFYCNPILLVSLALDFSIRSRPWWARPDGQHTFFLSENREQVLLKNITPQTAFTVIHPYQLGQYLAQRRSPVIKALRVKQELCCRD